MNFYMDKLKGSLAILGTAICYGSYGVWAKLIGSEFGLFFQTYTRAIIAWLIVIAIVIFLKQWRPIKSKFDYGVLVLISFLGIFTQSVYYAYLHLGIGLTSVLFFFAMLLVQFLIGIFLFKEKLTTIKTISVLLSLFGVYLIFKNDINTFQLFAVIVALVAGFWLGMP